MANEAMEAAWDGEEGEDWAERADQYDAVSARVMAAFLARLSVRPHDAVLDIGCGAGETSIEIAQRCPEGSVLGVDLSSRMLEVAAKRAASRGLTNLEFLRADAQVHSFGAGAFDLATSSFGTMFFDDPVAAFTNIASALKPAGRVFFIAWRPLQENEWLMGVRNSLAMGRNLGFPPLDAPTPFAQSDPERNRTLLAEAGFTDVEHIAVDAPMVLGTAEAAFEFLGQSGIAKGLTVELDEPTKRQAFEQLRQFMIDHESDEGVLLGSAAWIITARKSH